MNIKWGLLNNEEEIRKVILKLAGQTKGVRSVSFKHIASGFTDNVFLAKVTTETGGKEYIVKQYLKDWHTKEGSFYKEILSKNIFLGAPTLLFLGSNFIVLEYLKDSKLSPQNLNLLKNWIIDKHLFFNGYKQLDKYSESLDTKIHYLVDKPIISLKLIKDSKFVQDNHKNLVNQTIRLSDYFILLIENDLQRPQTLEHGDLEPQNIFVSGTKYLRVIDWVNARKGSGLFDINQFFETTAELGGNYNKNDLINEFSVKLNILNLAQLLDEVRILMLLNKTNYYSTKMLDGLVKSPSKNKLIIDLLDRYLNELFTLLAKTGKVQQA